VLAGSEHKHCLPFGMCAGVASVVVAFPASPFPGDWIRISLFTGMWQATPVGIIVCVNLSHSWKEQRTEGMCQTRAGPQGAIQLVYCGRYQYLNSCASRSGDAARQTENMDAS
jgi:hypothetical protein